MIRTIQLFLAIAFPWMVLLINNDPVGAFIALIMQTTLIGWVPASIWAWRTVNKKHKKQPKKNKTTLKNNQE